MAVSYHPAAPAQIATNSLVSRAAKPQPTSQQLPCRHPVHPVGGRADGAWGHSRAGLFVAMALEIFSRGDREIGRFCGFETVGARPRLRGATWQIGNVLDRAHGLQILTTWRGRKLLERLVSGCVAKV